MPDNTKKKFITREEILNRQDRIYEEVFVPPWDSWALVRSLSGKERDRFEKDIVELKGVGRKAQVITKDNIRARLVALTVVDPETKKPVFEPADVEALGEKNAVALDTIFAVAQRLSRLSDEDVEELVKNSAQTQDEGSTLN